MRQRRLKRTIMIQITDDIILDGDRYSYHIKFKSIRTRKDNGEKYVYYGDVKYASSIEDVFRIIYDHYTKEAVMSDKTHTVKELWNKLVEIKREFMDLVVMDDVKQLRKNKVR